MRTFETCCYEGFMKVKKVTNSGIIILTLDYAVYEEVNREYFCLRNSQHQCEW